MVKKIEVSEETYEKIKDQLAGTEEVILEAMDLEGGKYFFRTVTYHCVGEVVACIDDDFIALKDASWVADSGRFMQAIKDGTLSEVEPVGVMYLNMKSVVDFFPWNHPLPKEQK